MFWRFGFASTSTLDTLLDRPNVTLEEVLDEEDLLQECKGQNQKLIDYLQQPRVLKRLLEHVVGTADVGGGSGRDWEEKVRFKYPYMASEVLSCDIWAIVETVMSNAEDLLVPFWDTILSSHPTPAQAPIPHHSHPLLAGSPQASPRLGVTNMTDERHGSTGEGVSASGGSDTDVQDQTGTGGPGRSVLAGYWAKVNGVFLDKKPREMLAFIRSLPRIVERFVAHLEIPAVVDLLYRVIQCEDNLPAAGVVDWLSDRDLIPQLVELLSPQYSTDLHNTVSELLKAIIALSAPSPASLSQNQSAEAFGGAGGFASGDSFGGGSVGSVNNRLVRELASEAMVRKMVGFMLDKVLPTRLVRRLTDAAEEQLARLSLDGIEEDAKPARRRPSKIGTPSSRLGPLRELNSDSSDSESALEEEDEPFQLPLNPRECPASESRSPTSQMDHRGSTATVRPTDFFPPVRPPTVPITPESATSSLVTVISVFIELIRKNNSDYFEQHLFHTLRTHLLQRQQEISERRTFRAADISTDSTDTIDGKAGAANAAKSEEDEEMEGMEEAMAELAGRLGIVHLGPMLKVLCERLHEFQALIEQPRSSNEIIPTTLGLLAPLTFERYRITELYAELLHCSNMALLNRAPGEGPSYSEDGTLLGGIEGLQVLARTLQGGDGPDVPDSSRATVESQVGMPSEGSSMDITNTGSNEQSSDEKVNIPTLAETAIQEEHSSAHPDQTAPSRSRSREASRHAREVSLTGTGSSEDPDDEALLNEVSLSDVGSNPFAETKSGANVSDEASDAGATVVPDAANAEEVKEEKEAKEAKEAKEDDHQEDDDDDAASIASALSGLSLAQLTTPHPSGPPSPIDDSAEYVIGDMLKKKFLDCGIIPSVLDLFFDYPWNNFLHNVVYDILQQFFNGRMDVGLNRRLTIAVFKNGRLTDKIVEGHMRNEKSTNGPRRIRLGYMGHMNLIAEETVKLLERYPYEIAAIVDDSIAQPDWDNFVNQTLRESREREAAPLAGGRPAPARTVPTAFGAGNEDDDDRQGDGGVGSDTFANYLSSQMSGDLKFSSSSDDEDDDEDDVSSWLSKDVSFEGNAPPRSSGFDDAFEPSKGFTSFGSGDAQDDEWGPFSDAGAQDFDFPPSTAPAADNPFAPRENLTPADWAAEFRREGTPEAPPPDDDGDDTSSSGGRDDEGTPTFGTSPTASFGTSPPAPFVDLGDVVAAAHRRRPSLGQHEATAPTTRRRASSSGGSSDPSAAQAAAHQEPLGPGVSADTETTDDGMLKRTMDDGSDVVVPLDDVALTTGSAEGQEVVASKAEAEEARSAENERAVVDDDDEK